MNMRRVLTEIVTISVAFAIGVAVAGPAVAAAYDRTEAAAYARQYSCNRNMDCRNDGFASFPGTDCTNFVSQALWAGNKPMVRSGTRVWYWLSKPTYSKSWTTVDGFVAFYKEAGKGRLSKVTQYQGSNMANAGSTALNGDVYLYDWGTGSGYSHLAIATGSGSFMYYYDPVNKKNYNSVTGGRGSFVAQHSTDRDGSPWNWGYWTSGVEVRAKMRTQVLHLTN